MRRNGGIFLVVFGGFVVYWGVGSDFEVFGCLLWGKAIMKVFISYSHKDEKWKDRLGSNAVRGGRGIL